MPGIKLSTPKAELCRRPRRRRSPAPLGDCLAQEAGGRRCFMARREWRAGFIVAVTRGRRTVERVLTSYDATAQQNRRISRAWRKYAGGNRQPGGKLRVSREGGSHADFVGSLAYNHGSRAARFYYGGRARPDLRIARPAGLRLWLCRDAGRHRPRRRLLDSTAGAEGRF